MKAALFTTFGSPDVLHLADVATPQPGPGEVRVRILAAGLNRIDHYVREGAVSRDLPLPRILGADASAVVDANGPGATRFALLQRVIPLPGHPRDAGHAAFHPLSAAPSYAIRGIIDAGSYAEYMVVPERWLVADDTGLSPTEVATLPLVLVTAVRAVKVVGEVRENQFVLVNAGGSGSGSMNIQVARTLGARVATTVRGSVKAELARSLGAELVIDLTSEPDFVTAVRNWSGGGVHAVIDNLGGDILTRSLEALRPLGILVAMGIVTGGESRIPIFPLFFAQKQIRGTLMGDLDDLRWGLEHVRAGRIRPVLDRVYPLAEAAAAHARLAAGEALGSIVLTP